MSNERPNIVMIVVDSARYDGPSFHGYHRRTTPFLDTLAEESTDYTNANAPAGATRFSMNSIFVGLYPEAFGFSKGKLPSPGQITLAQRLHAAGYETMLFSSDPCVSPDTHLDRGFDEVFYLVPWSSAPWQRPMLMMRHLPKVIASAVNRTVSYKVPVEILVGQATRTLKARSPNDRPFFLYIHLDVHRPFISERRLLRRFLEPDVMENEIRDVEQRQRQCYFYTGAEDMVPPRSDRLHSVVRSMYDASWFKTDRQIRQLVSVLRRRGLFDSTAVVITSDHGEFLGERNLFRHGVFPYQQAMHVPLLVKYPKSMGREPGPDCRLTTTIDLLPTLCDLAGCPVNEDETNGVSLLDADRCHEFIINQRWTYKRDDLENLKAKYPHGDWTTYDLGHVIALRDERFKYVESSRGRRFLFDMENDPDEEKNLAPEAGPLVAHYEQKLSDWRENLLVREGWDESKLRPQRRPFIPIGR